MNRGESADEELSALSWSDLVAKLAAARDLRGTLTQEEEAALASFDPDCAAHIASHQDKFPEDSKRDVNPNGLGNSKGTGGSVVSPNDNDDPAIRGNS
ncbi:hypothetical protein [Aurantiacibacter sediminis]|uniref:Uncharacterized protein n=1 Tax=Aurantiacibacter sediminis TaxID=2793064 RepID=A0ABS0N068_9SPHN|nr:hypothetical protein [Aurantiacibacter sediminis]MBH5321353.1 hypothetical protein [Aurantiacibacter sediminis]